MVATGGGDTEQQLCHQGEEENHPFPDLAPYTLEKLEYNITARVKSDNSPSLTEQNVDEGDVGGAVRT